MLNPISPHRIRHWRHFRQAVIFMLLVLLFLLMQWLVKTYQKPSHMGIIESQSMDMTVQVPEGNAPVQTETVTFEPFESTVSYTGSVVAYNDITVIPRVEGWIKAMPVYPGDRVQKGQLLAQLDTRELSSRVREAEYGSLAETQAYQAALGSTDQARAEVQRAQQGIQAAKANLTYWQNEIQRAQTLSKEEVITTEEFQREQSQFEAAQSQYNQALSQLHVAQKAAQASSLQAQSQQARAEQAAQNQRTQEIIQGYTTIRAQRSGVITERLASPGTLVNPQTPIFRLAQIHPIRIQANVAGSDLKDIHIGSPVQIWDKDNAENAVSAEVTAVFPQSNLQTRTAIVEAVIPNEGERFIPGDYVVMEIATGKKTEALSVLNQALTRVGQQTAVWVVEDGKAQRRYVTTGSTNGKRTEIVSGLEVGNVVVTQGQEGLQEDVAIVSGEYGPQGLKALPKGFSSNRLDTSNQYRSRQSLKHQVVSIELKQKPPRIGENKLLVEISSPHGAVSDNLALTADLMMPAMASMSNAKPKIQKTAPGQFNVYVMFSMPGLWQVNLTLKQGNTVLGQAMVETKVPD